ncbi:hypothetical protein DMN77_08135 [Paenibacillus sp. 79R4]|nr:hypothetical protein [Paenibacillus sp. 79R4]
MIGYISSEFTVWCGKCSKWEQVSTISKTFAAKEFTKSGWRKTKEHGWVCPSCKKKPKEGYKI